MEDWKELNIKDIPDGLFTNVDYDFEEFQDGSWVTWVIDLEYRYLLVKDFKKGNIRYRLKPLKTIKITENVKEFLLTAFQVVDSEIECRYDSENIFSFDNREVEIIK